MLFQPKDGYELLQTRENHVNTVTTDREILFLNEALVYKLFQWFSIGQLNCREETGTHVEARKAHLFFFVLLLFQFTPFVLESSRDLSLHDHTTF